MISDFVEPSSSSALLFPIFLAVCVLGGAALAVLTILQTDELGRHFLSAEQLHSRRRAEYRHRWNQCLERAKLQLQHYLAGGIDYHHVEEELLRTEIITQDEAVSTFAKKLLLRNDASTSLTNAPYRVGRIGTDERVAQKEIYAWLIDKQRDLHQLPLLSFVEVAGPLLEEQSCPLNFCFVADASASVAGTVLTEVLRINQPLMETVVLEQPLWMLQLAVIAGRKLFPKPSLLKIARVLCRLEANAAVAAMKDETACKTLVVMLPGMATTPTLLPLLQEAFPDERHVFSYTGCWNAVQYATFQRNQRFSRQYVPPTLDRALTLAPEVRENQTNDKVEATGSLTSVAPYTTPLATPLGTRSPHVDSKTYVKCLAGLPIYHADIVESWMTAVDALHQTRENQKIFQPFLFRVDYLVSGVLDNSQWKQGSDPYGCLVDLLQYVTGKAPSPEALDAAISWLRDHAHILVLPDSSKVTGAAKQAVEQTVLQHECLPTENHVLSGTMKPAKSVTMVR